MLARRGERAEPTWRLVGRSPTNTKREARRGLTGMLRLELARYGISVFDDDSDGKIVAIDVQGQRNIVRIKPWAVHIVEFRNLSSGQDHLASSIGISTSSFQQIAQIESAYFILARADAAFFAHGYERYPSSCQRA